MINTHTPQKAIKHLELDTPSIKTYQMLDYNGYIDTIKLRAKVRLTKGGGALFSRTTKLNNNEPDSWGPTYKLENTTYRHGYTKVPELVMSQDYNGSIKCYTHKNFTAEYGYHIYTQVPGWLYYLCLLYTSPSPRD